MTVPIPEESIEAATQALKVSEAPDVAADAEAWFRAHAEATVRAAAPLIVAAELDRLAESINAPRIRERSIAGQLTAVDLVREDLLARASVLRGEGQTSVADDELPGLWSNADLSGGMADSGEGQQ